VIISCVVEKGLCNLGRLKHAASSFRADTILKFMHSANLSVNSGLTCLCWEIKPTL